MDTFIKYTYALHQNLFAEELKRRVSSGLTVARKLKKRTKVAYALEFSGLVAIYHSILEFIVLENLFCLVC